MNKQEVLVLYDQEIRIEREVPAVRCERFPFMVRAIQEPPGVNVVRYSHLPEDEMDELIHEEIAYFSTMDQPFEWIVCDHDQPPDLQQRLESHGFVADEPGAIMVLDLEHVPAELLKARAHDIRQIGDRAGLVDVIAVLEAVWGGDFGWVNGRMGRHLEVPGYLSIYVGYLDGRPASTGWTYFHPGSHFAGLWGGSTVEALRGKGLYRALLARRVREAMERGYRYLMIEANPNSRAIVERYGFELITCSRALEWPRESQ